MGLFFRGVPSASALGEPSRATIGSGPPDPEQAADAGANRVASQASGSLAWDRLAVALILLVVVLAACIYSAQSPKTLKLYEILLHSFELLLGAVIGLITGEAIGQR